MASVFEAATGDGPALPAGSARQRAAKVRTAYEGLLQIRRLTGAVPAVWELNQMVRAVALALEAAGLPPSAVDTVNAVGAAHAVDKAGAEGVRTATGYRVRAADRPGAVRVEWVGPAGGGAAGEEQPRLTECAAALSRTGGWEALLYKGPKGRRFLEVEPFAGPRSP